jgi:hypothetical protein
MCWRFAKRKTQRCGGGKASTMYCRVAVSLLGKDFEAVVEEYDSFGESAFTITLKERKKKASG